jgi:hypothetical protein
MTLPTSRDFTAVDSGPLPATSVNNIQDGIVDHGHGDIVKQIGGISGDSNDAGATRAGTYIYAQMTASGDKWYMELNMRVGDRIKSVSAFIRDAATTITARVRDVDMDAGSQTTPGTTSSSGGAADEEVVVTMAGAGHVVVAHHRIALEITNDGANTVRVYGAEVTYDHP